MMLRHKVLLETLSHVGVSLGTLFFRLPALDGMAGISENAVDGGDAGNAIGVANALS